MKVNRKKWLFCYFFWPLPFNLSDMGGPTTSQHSYPGQWAPQKCDSTREAITFEYVCICRVTTE